MTKKRHEYVKLAGRRSVGWMNAVMLGRLYRVEVNARGSLARVKRHRERSVDKCHFRRWQRNAALPYSSNAAQRRQDVRYRLLSTVAIIPTTFTSVRKLFMISRLCSMELGGSRGGNNCQGLRIGHR
jgi:hypothetical protein